jgi:hypothetical protein
MSLSSERPERGGSRCNSRIKIMKKYYSVFDGRSSYHRLSITNNAKKARLKIIIIFSSSLLIAQTHFLFDPWKIVCFA